ncbi:MAG: PAS domain-containing protein [Gemmatimonadaceae bacterium]|nr:PAS domain-containing protein [Gemmatimonadaceae bacterium]
MADLISRTAPLYTAEVWAQELRSLNTRRVLLVLASLALNAIFLLTDTGDPTRDKFVGYGLWLLCIAGVSLWSRHVRTTDGQLRLLTGSFVIDTAIVTMLMYATGGGWWLGAIFHGIIIAVATLTLPPSTSRWILWVALVGWSALILPPALGWLDPDPLYGLPRVRGAFGLLITQYGLGVLALAAIDRLVRAQVKRTEAVNASTRRVLDAAPNAIFVLDRDGRVRVANEASQRQLGFTSDALVGRGLIRFVPSTDHARVRAMFARAMAGEVITFEHAMQRSDGSVRWISVSYAPLLQPTGDTAVIAIARDLTDEREAAVEREALQQEVARTRRLESIGRLVSGVAHELNNPLTAVMSFTEQLLADAPDGVTREALTVVQSQADRARSVVRDLLQVVRDGSGRERTVVALSELLATSVRAFENAAPRHLGARLRECGARRQCHHRTHRA